MRRTLLGFGIIILFAGLIIFSISNRFTETYESVSVEESDVEDLPYGEWKTSAHFEKGETIYLAFSGPDLAMVPNGDQISGTVMINITDPEGEDTTFRVDFKGSEPPEINITLISEAEGLEVDDSPFGDFNDSPVGFGGVTSYEGDYSGCIYVFGPGIAGFYYPPNATLPYMMFWKLVPIRTYPNSPLLPVGGIFIVAGLLLSVWAVRSSQQPRRGKRK